MIKKVKIRERPRIDAEFRRGFMAMYIGCQVAYPQDDEPEITIAKLSSVGIDYIETTYKEPLVRPGQMDLHGDCLSFKSNGLHNVDALHTAVILRSSSWLADEEYRKISYLLHKIELPVGSAITVGRGYMESLTKNGFQECNIEIYQYLVSIGVQMPFRGYTTNELYEANLIGYLSSKTIISYKPLDGGVWKRNARPKSVK